MAQTEPSPMALFFAILQLNLDALQVFVKR